MSKSWQMWDSSAYFTGGLSAGIFVGDFSNPTHKRIKRFFNRFGYNTYEGEMSHTDLDRYPSRAPAGFRFLLIAVAALLIVAQGPGAALATPPIPADAQSTTGPIPPKGVDTKGAVAASPQAVTIPGVPAYIWHHGCGPTAAGMVIGYWDGHAFDALVPGSAATQTDAVNAMMATEGPHSHYSDYSSPIDSPPNLQPDLSEPPPGDEHANNCVADYMHTSQSYYSNYYGWSWFSDVAPSMVGYVDWLGVPSYSASASNRYMWRGPYLTWDDFRAEIDAGRPVVLLVDSDGDGSTDHFVPAIGYDEPGGVQRYACLNTWDTGIHWYDFRPMATGQAWGIYGAVFFDLIEMPVGDHLVYLPAITRNAWPSPGEERVLPIPATR
jgi:hypothetical protein